MGKFAVNKVCMAWLMAVLLVMPFAVKTVHTCLLERNVHHLHHECETCPVCQFSFPVFVEEASAALDLPVPCADGSPEAVPSERPCRPVFIPYGLRAPPAA